MKNFIKNFLEKKRIRKEEKRKILIEKYLKKRSEIHKELEGRIGINLKSQTFVDKF